MSENLAKSKRITVEYLTKYAERFLEEKYGFKLAIPIEINNRLRSTQGSYLTKISTGQPVGIEIAGYVVKYGSEWAILDVLKHELIHYAVHCLGEDWSDGTEYFENELRKHGVSSTETGRIGKNYLIVCDGCGSEIEIRTRKQVTHPDGYRTGCCGTKYEYIGDVIYNGIERKETIF